MTSQTCIRGDGGKARWMPTSGPVVWAPAADPSEETMWITMLSIKALSQPIPAENPDCWEHCKIPQFLHVMGSLSRSKKHHVPLIKGPNAIPKVINSYENWDWPHLARGFGDSPSTNCSKSLELQGSSLWVEAWASDPICIPAHFDAQTVGIWTRTRGHPDAWSGCTFVPNLPAWKSL